MQTFTVERDVYDNYLVIAQDIERKTRQAVVAQLVNKGTAEKMAEALNNAVMTVWMGGV